MTTEGSLSTFCWQGGLRKLHSTRTANICSMRYGEYALILKVYFNSGCIPTLQHSHCIQLPSTASIPSSWLPLPLPPLIINSWWTPFCSSLRPTTQRRKQRGLSCTPLCAAPSCPLRIVRRHLSSWQCLRRWSWM